ncbi:MAG: DUF4159 domain-containing protein [Alphaproteobacteria bacterium]|nr:MAG: DUF4159 domain-containing protein [Alphaproteobacteria bacterium]
MTLGALTFTHPWILIGLLALPALWWLLKLIPPTPRQVSFPPIQFLLQLRDVASTASTTPWWLLALRMILLTLIITALSGPEIRRTPPVTNSDKPLLLLIDNGWASAHDWQKRLDALRSLIDEASLQSRTVMLVPTAPTRAGNGSASLLSPRQARAALAALAPQPWATDRLKALETAVANLKGSSQQFDIVWLSDGLADKKLAPLADRLKALGETRVLTLPGPTGALILRAPDIYPDRLAFRVLRTNFNAPASGEIRARDAKNQTLALAPFAFEPGVQEALVDLKLPLEIRNRIGRVTIENHASAAATFLIDERWRRRAVGIVTQLSDIEKPLLSEVFYLERALAPYADLRKGSIRKLIGDNIDTLLMPDQGSLSEEELTALREWMAAGGTLVRFSSSHLAADPNGLTPVHLRGGNRALGGALSWDTPQKLDAFPETSPFWGLTIPEEVTVSQQVLAEPAVDLSQKTWAQLADGTPIVTADRQGKGWLVLFHVTAKPDWSNLPLSGLYVEMLRRLIDISVGTDPAGNVTSESLRHLTPQAILDGFGALTDPSPGQSSLSLTEMPWTPSPDHPPGVYENAVTTKALNLAMADLQSAPLQDLPEGIIAVSGEKTPALHLLPPLLGLAFALAIVDGFLVLVLSGAWSSSRKLAAAAIALIVAVPGHPALLPKANAQDATSDKNMQAALQTRLAYVITGNPSLDAISKAGLEGLTVTLVRRTAAEPGAPLGVNLDDDELAFYPLLYFPVRADQPLLSPHVVEKLNAYMARGGTLLMDSGDHQLSIGGFGAGPDSARMREILRQLDVPPLVEVPRDHILTKSFYLIQDYPGRWVGGALWVEAQKDQGRDLVAANDGVTPIIIGSNDYASAWAIDENGRPRVPLVPGGPTQREGAMRFGVNLVMYTLTGNYKADQVHVPALLERLGQ